MRPKLILLILALVAAGCSGPSPSLDLGVKEVPSDIVLGSPESGAPVPAPVPPSAPVLVGPGLPPSIFDQPATGPTRVPTTTSPPLACPATDPLAAPKREATTRVSDPPPSGTLPYRVDGEFTVSGANARSGKFPAVSRRTIGKVTGTGNGFTYEVAASLAGTITTTGYQVIRTSGAAGEAGLYVTSVSTEAPSGAESRFQPALPIKLVDFPMVANTDLTAAGTDPMTATTVSWTTKVMQKTRVAACGVPLDAIVVRLSGGRVDGPSTNVDFTATYAIATQFGGISLADTVEMQGREGFDDVARKITSTVTLDPERLA